MDEVTQLLQRARSGEPDQLQQVFVSLYAQLRRIAGARVGQAPQTLTPTALVHEAYLRLTGADALEITDRRHFFACAAQAMRAILVDRARRACAGKRGGPARDLDLDAAAGQGEDFPEDLIALDAALTQLEDINPRQRQVVELHYFAGLTYPEIGALLGCDERTAKREWERGRACLYALLAP